MQGDAVTVVSDGRNLPVFQVAMEDRTHWRKIVGCDAYDLREFLLTVGHALGQAEIELSHADIYAELGTAYRTLKYRLMLLEQCGLITWFDSRQVAVRNLQPETPTKARVDEIRSWLKAMSEDATAHKTQRDFAKGRLRELEAFKPLDFDRFKRMAWQVQAVEPEAVSEGCEVDEAAGDAEAQDNSELLIAIGFTGSAVQKLAVKDSALISSVYWYALAQGVASVPAYMSRTLRGSGTKGFDRQQPNWLAFGVWWRDASVADRDALVAHLGGSGAGEPPEMAVKTLQVAKQIWGMAGTFEVPVPAETLRPTTRSSDEAWEAVQRFRRGSVKASALTGHAHSFVKAIGGTSGMNGATDEKLRREFEKFVSTQ